MKLAAAVVVLAACASQPGRRSAAWTVAGIAPAAVVGGTAGGLAFYVPAQASPTLSDEVEAGGTVAFAALGAAAAGVGGYFLGECARGESVGCRVAVIVADCVVATGAIFATAVLVTVAHGFR